MGEIKIQSSIRFN